MRSRSLAGTPSPSSPQTQAGELGARVTLPARLLREPVRLGSGRDAALTPARLREMIDGYYAARGLDQDGRPTSEAFADLLVSCPQGALL
ncbi:MAG: hypothetical protein JO309_05630 [Pseudonocardiales bacterium]|nr:hypothetical protein [Pseudonocardiales bacterium]